MQPGQTFALAKLVKRSVGGNAIGPGAERCSLIKARQAPSDLDECFLASVVGILGPAGDPATDCVDAVVVAAQELVHRASIATLGCGDQLIIGERIHQRDISLIGLSDQGNFAEPTPERVVVTARCVGPKLLQKDEQVAYGSGWNVGLQHFAFGGEPSSTQLTIPAA